MAVSVTHVVIALADTIWGELIGTYTENFEPVRPEFGDFLAATLGRPFPQLPRLRSFVSDWVGILP